MRKWGSLTMILAFLAFIVFLTACSSDDSDEVVVKSSVVAPTGIEATATGEFVNVSWEAVDGAVKYNVYRKTQGETGYTLIATRTETFFIDNVATLEDVSQIFYRISSVDADGDEGAMSAPLSATCFPPAALKDLRAFSQQATGTNDVNLFIRVEWPAALNATHYELHFADRPFPAEGGADEVQTIIRTTAATTHDVFHDFAPEKFYFFRVRVISGCGVSEFSNMDSASTGCLTPQIPVGLTTVVEQNTIRVSWNRVPGATRYVIGITGVPGMNSRTVSDTTSVFNVGFGVRGVFTVRAENDCGLGRVSVPVVATTPCDPGTVPAGVAGTAAVAQGQTRILITWTESTDQTVSGYQIFRSATENGTFALAGSVNGRQNARFSDTTGLVAGTTYFYKVAAVNACGISNVFTQAPVSDRTWVNCAGENGAPTVPANVAVVIRTETQMPEMRISWDRNVNADSYRVYRVSGSGTDVVRNLIGTTREAFFIDVNLLPNTSFSYSVRAVNSCDTSAFSPAVSRTTDIFVPETPATFGYTPLSATRVLLEWDASRGADSYELYRSSGSTFTLHRTLTETFFVDSDLDSTRTYKYFVIGTHSRGTDGSRSQASDTISVGPLGRDCGTMTVSEVMATPASDTSIVISWTGSAESFNVYRGIVSGINAATLIQRNVRGHSFTDRSVNRDIAYYYFVSAVNACGIESAKTVASNNPVVICERATAVSGLQVQNISTAASTIFRISWNDQANAARYLVQRALAEGTDTNWSFITPAPTGGLAGIAGTVFVDDAQTLVAGTTYRYRVISVNICGVNGDTSAIQTAINCIRPVAVSGLEAEALNQGNAVRLKWERADIPMEGGYNIYRSENENGPFVWVARVPQIASDLDILPTRDITTHLEFETTYWFRITTEIPCGGGVIESEHVGANTVSVRTLCDLSISSITYDGTRFVWSRVNGATGYDLVITRWASGTPFTEFNGMVEGNLYDFTALPGATYSARVRARRGTGISTVISPVWTDLGASILVPIP
ncbi:MAG: hypothetical protein FWE23_03220 [Chitinivibrionia bacterium]|nr:hypothetical protein [Chitinivibrionia bacterium]